MRFNFVYQLSIMVIMGLFLWLIVEKSGSISSDAAV